jgi:hypothetical protein
MMPDAFQCPVSRYSGGLHKAHGQLSRSPPPLPQGKPGGFHFWDRSMVRFISSSIARFMRMAQLGRTIIIKPKRAQRIMSK